jgi:small acid-soluble spore protein D (minor alpha/beta-type SASP)
MASNKITVPEAKAALDKFKMQAASEVGVTLNQNGYNGDLTARQAGSIGGQMVNNVTPIRLQKIDRINRRSLGHVDTITYKFSFTI